MIERPLVTCFMLTYNNFQYIYDALESILKQTYPLIELAIFDDCSDYFPQKDIEEYITNNKKENIKNVIIHRNHENLGTVKNFNAVIDHTNGKYLLGAGSDDVLYSNNVFKKVVEFFEETDAYAVTCYRETLDDSAKKNNVVPAKRNAERIKKASAEELYKMVAMGVAIAGAGTYYSRKIFEEMGKFDERYTLQEDGPFFLRMLRNGYKLEFADIIAVKYRLGNGVSSAKELHPALKKDINNMLQNEVVPYFDKFNFWEKRRIYYQLERFKMSKQLSKKEKIYFCLKYPDVLIYRKLMAT